MRRAVMGAACAFAVVTGVVAPTSAGAASNRPGKRQVVAAFYPIAYAAQQIGGSRVSVTNLTPAGAEPHDLELSPAQMDRLLDADAAFVMGHGFQPAVEKAAQQRDGVTVDVLDKLPIGAGRKKIKAEGSSSGLDPHVWLDPVLMQGIVREVQRGLTKSDPKGAAVYAKNADALVAALEALDAKFRAGLAHCSRDLIVTSHEAFGYLAARYGLRQEGAAGIDPTAEPDARRIAELTDLVKKNGVTVVFTESLVSSRVADTLAREAGVKTDTLDPLEGLSGKKQAAGDDYFTVMDTNLRKVRAALGCS